MRGPVCTRLVMLCVSVWSAVTLLFLMWNRSGQLMGGLPLSCSMWLCRLAKLGFLNSLTRCVWICLCVLTLWVSIMNRVKSGRGNRRLSGRQKCGELVLMRVMKPLTLGLLVSIVLRCWVVVLAVLSESFLGSPTLISSLSCAEDGKNRRRMKLKLVIDIVSVVVARLTIS